MSDTAPLKNDLLLRALLREPTERTPVWMMRQAGRYLPEYRQLREQVNGFLGLATNPDLACEVTLQPLRRFPLDAAILFSDILTVPDAMGLGLYFESGEGPRFERPLRSAADIDALGVPDPEDGTGYVMEAVRRIRRALDGQVPLIGFAGSPWTLATYMVEGRSSRDFATIKALRYQDPAALERLLSTLSTAVAAYLNAQVAAGAQALMIFDTWGGALDAEGYRRYSLDPGRALLDALVREAEGRRVPVIWFTKGGALQLEAQADAGFDALGLDWTIDIGAARQRVGDRVALQGNLDPAALLAEPAAIREQVGRILESYGHGSGHVFNLGHGITPQVPPEHAAAMIDAVHELSPAWHASATG